MPFQSASRPAAEPSDAICSARRAITTETEGMKLLLAALDGELGAALTEAVALIAKARGRVILSGMGKSGHIAKKIAATLASTGTPALFVHPAEASHGDLGMITKADAIVMISNSGESEELKDMLAYSRRFEVPLIAVTARAGSALAREADVVLLLPDAAEACPIGLAPTTSTLLQLALGDALAIALLEAKGFSAKDFRMFHPGGKLGAQLTHVSALMHKGMSVPLAGPLTPMSEALMIMTGKSFGCVGVVDAEGRLSGIVTDGDLRRHVGDNLLARTAAEVMTAAPKTISPDALAPEALAILNKHTITSLFVVDGDHRPVGLIHIHDLLRLGVS